MKEKSEGSTYSTQQGHQKALAQLPAPFRYTDTEILALTDTRTLTAEALAHTHTCIRSQSIA